MVQEGLSKELITYFMGHAKNMNDMGERYTNIEEIGNDIGDIGLLVDNGKKVLGIIDSYFAKRGSNIHIEKKEVEITNRRGNKVKFYTYCLTGYDSFIEYEEE
jgi:hypothetical protein